MDFHLLFLFKDIMYSAADDLFSTEHNAVVKGTHMKEDDKFEDDEDEEDMEHGSGIDQPLNMPMSQTGGGQSEP